jgi:hypothetical protein
MAKVKGKGFLGGEDGSLVEVDGFNHHVLFQVTGVNRETGEVAARFIEHGEPDLPEVGDALQVAWFEVEEEPEQVPVRLVPRPGAAERLERQTRCDHKFVDSKQCLKCGWVPPAVVPAFDEGGGP